MSVSAWATGKCGCGDHTEGCAQCVSYSGYGATHACFCACDCHGLGVEPATEDGDRYPEPWDQTRRRMYSAGYHNGARLAHVPLAKRDRETDPHLIRLGANAYAQGFDDGHAGRPPRFPLIPKDRR